MKEKHFKDVSWLPYMSKTVNYNSWIFGEYREFVGGTVIDIGAGTGTFVDFLKNKKKIFILEVSDGNIRALKNKYKRSKTTKILKGDLSKGAFLPRLKKARADTVICLNTLEHVKDDEAMIKNIRACLKPGGHFILFVPALKPLFGTLDVNLGHYRRYNREELEKMLRQSKFKIVKSKYLNIIGTLSWFIYGRLLKRVRVKEKRIVFYDKWIVPLIASLEKALPPPFGQSILIVARAR